MNTSERKYSIVMTCYDQATELESNLPAFLTQEYEPGYEVIVWPLSGPVITVLTVPRLHRPSACAPWGL